MSIKHKISPFPPCTPKHHIERPDIPSEVQLEREINFYNFCNFSTGPVRIDTSIDIIDTSINIEEFEDDIPISQLYALSENSDNSLYPFPAEGYQKHINPETGKELPYCCNFHQEVFNEASRWFEVFPNCCPKHREFLKIERFDKSKFSYMPEKIVIMLSQTEHLICQEIDKPDWEKSITGYIDYNFICFKSYAIGLNIYLKNLEQYICNSVELIPVYKADKLVEYLKYVEKYYQLSEDYNYKYPLLKRWSEEFPFETSYFKSDIWKAEEMTILLPLDTNTKKLKYESLRYSLNKEKVLKSLESITSFMISSINIKDKDLLSNSDKNEFELLNEKRKLKLKYSYNSANNKPDYINLIEEWLKDEIEYYQQIKPLIKKMNPQELLSYTETDPEDLTKEEITATRKLIEKYFSEMGSKGKYGWEYAFKRKADYDAFVELLEKFFTHSEHEIPLEPIDLKYGSKTHMATALGSIHAELGERLSTDTKFFKIVKLLSYFKDESQQSMYKALTRHRAL